MNNKIEECLQNLKHAMINLSYNWSEELNKNDPFDGEIQELTPKVIEWVNEIISERYKK